MKISIKEGMSEAQTAKTGVYEVAYAKLHAKEIGQDTERAAYKDREAMEVMQKALPTLFASISGLVHQIILSGILPGGAAGRKCRN